jgi:hypothetical protein
MFFVVFWDYQEFKQLGIITSYSNMDVLATINARVQQIAQPPLLSILPSHLQLGQQDFHGCGK